MKISAREWHCGCLYTTTGNVYRTCVISSCHHCFGLARQTFLFCRRKCKLKKLTVIHCVSVHIWNNRTFSKLTYPFLSRSRWNIRRSCGFKHHCIIRRNSERRTGRATQTYLLLHHEGEICVILYALFYHSEHYCTACSVVYSLALHEALAVLYKIGNKSHNVPKVHKL